ncbi:hypothetical protein [Streptomyces sp. NBRC 110611]|uniref:hypothetical protein n=1 Tax=Streptomyces sp. NBRC 110611 TaxID=1621259 RepID=UPI00082DF85C|nr:hypothetical protein [Streptomyces sp. NBRC 110611]
MLPSVSILQQIGLGVLLTVAVVWAVVLVRLLRYGRYETAMRRDRREMRARYTERGRGPEEVPAVPELLGTVPRQTGPAGPPAECVQLTAEEREAFEGLVRQLTSRS